MSSSLTQQRTQDSAQNLRGRPLLRRQTTGSSTVSSKRHEYKPKDVLGNIDVDLSLQNFAPAQEVDNKTPAGSSQRQEQHFNRFGRPALSSRDETSTTQTPKVPGIGGGNKLFYDTDLVPLPERREPGIDVPAIKHRPSVNHYSPSTTGPRRTSVGGHRSRNSGAILRADLLDLNPWTGQHAEDRLTDAVIKNGYYEKALVPVETNSAKPTLWPHLKNGSGIERLSALFVDVFQRKETAGILTANSTFKPPPRVTLTDTKKESWLRDLSNPVVPLRRLSRTIPHGIRGKALLDQCVTKDIPVERAVWLARCVGANELRAFRRKGMSTVSIVENEVRWMKEWTAMVENLYQECVATREQPDWKRRVRYIMQLTFHYYKAGLLDNEHFLDWLLINFCECLSSSLLLSLLSLHSYWVDITTDLCSVRRLATTCLQRLNVICDAPETERYKPVVDRLYGMARVLVVQHPLALLCPSRWNQLSICFGRLTPNADDNVRDAVQSLSSRNSRLFHGWYDDKSTSTKDEDAIIHFLDTTSTPIIYERFASLLAGIPMALSQVITITLHWACSLYRGAEYRCYAALVILRNLLVLHSEAGDTLLKSLSMFHSSEVVDFRSLARIVAELIRSRDFDAGRYLRWLISNGAMNGPDRRVCDREIVRNLPRQEQSVENLRRMLLVDTESHRADIATSALVELACTTIRSGDWPQMDDHESIGSILPCSIGQLATGDLFRLSEAISQRLTACMNLYIKYNSLNLSSHDSTAPPRSSDIISLLQALVDLGDFQALADVLMQAVRCADIVLLAWTAHTCDRWTDIVRTIDPTRTLQRALIQRYRFLRLSELPSRDIASSLAPISKNSGWADAAQYFLHEIAASDANEAATAFTPLSDAQLEAVTSYETDVSDDLEHMLTTLSVLDERVVARVLDLAALGDKQVAQDQHAGAATIQQLLRRMRSINGDSFRELVDQWIFARLIDAQVQPTFTAIVTLIKTGCTSLASFIGDADKRCETLSISGDRQTTAQFSISVLHLMLLLEDTEYCILSKLGSDTTCSAAVLRLLHQTLYLNLGIDGTPHPHLRGLISNDHLLAFLHNELLLQPAVFVSELNLSSIAQGHDAARDLINRLLDPKDTFGFRTLPLEKVIHKIFDIVDSFSLPCFQVGLSFLTMQIGTSGLDTGNIAAATLNAAKAASTRGCRLWAQLLSSSSRHLKAEIQTIVQTSLLHSLSQITDDIDEHEPQSEVVGTINQWLNLLKVTTTHVVSKLDTDLAQIVIVLLEVLSRQPRSTAKPGLQSQGAKAYDVGVSKSGVSWPETMLDLCLVNAHVFHQHTALKISVLSVLSNILVINKLNLNSQVLEYVLDLMVHMSNNISSSELTALRSSLGPLAEHPLLRYVFGFRQSSDSWLHVKFDPGSNAHSTPKPSQDAMDISESQPLHANHKHMPSIPYPLHHWELLSDSTPNIGLNDTALNMRLFNARKA